jgi:hypothetical protein
LHQHNRFEPPFEFKIFYASILRDARIDRIETNNKTSEIKNKVCAITAALPPIMANPDTPDISAMIKNIIALRTIDLKFIDSGIEMVSKKSCRFKTA